MGINIFLIFFLVVGGLGIAIGLGISKIKNRNKPITKDIQTNNIKESLSKNSKLRKRIIIVVSIIFVILIGIAIYKSPLGLDDDESGALHTLKIIKGNLKKPSSLEVFDICMVYNENSNSRTYYVDYSGENSFGGTARGYAKYDVYRGKIYYEKDDISISVNYLSCITNDGQTKNYNRYRKIDYQKIFRKL